ncbi:Sinapoylglucose--sinapoylglucose O-sinapoyltransferase [Bertholletia excelsa]
MEKFCEHMKTKTFRFLLLTESEILTCLFDLNKVTTLFHLRVCGCGGKKDAQLFYYFVESQRSPDHDPLILWFSGGPGCSSFSAFFYENGPLYLELEGDIDGLPKLSLNKNSWTQLANILYVDVPVGSGFSYSKTQEGYYVDDSKHAKQTYEFLRKWLNSYPKYLENNLYIGGDSYSGIPVPMVVQEIVRVNEANCKGSYVNIDSTISNADQILKPSIRWSNENERRVMGTKCNFTIFLGNKRLWQRCNRSLAYKNDVLSSVPYHRNLTEASLRALIYSGDHDMIVPHVSTQEWINSLNLTLSRAWRPWFVEDQVAGYTKWFTKGNYSLTFATVKGAGHVPPMYKPKECYTMFERWLAYNPL